jgi:transposase
VLLAVHVSPANLSDRDGAVELLRRLDRRHLPRRHGWADSGYRGAFLAWALARSKIAFEVVVRADGGRRRRRLPPGAEPPVVPRFAVVPRRWVVERTFAWLARFRRLSKDYKSILASISRVSPSGHGLPLGSSSSSPLHSSSSG